MNDTIFISIAAYCDERLTHTVEDALAKAKYPDRLRFGIVEQQETDKRLNLEKLNNKNIRYLGVDPVESRGACWARAVVMTLYCNEDWYFQIDSHMVFEQNWDEWFVNEINRCSKFSKKPIISGYPRNYKLIDGQIVLPTERGVQVNILHPEAPFEIVFNPSNYTLHFMAATLDTNETLYGFHIGGNCVFAAGTFVNEIPYDFRFYFEGEEQALALRAYTHGWDILHVPNMPIYHLQDRETRTSHWDGEPNKKRKEPWWDLKTQAIQQLTKMVKDKSLGAYFLGTERTLADYAEFCGLDYENNVIGEKARRGPWMQNLE